MFAVRRSHLLVVLGRVLFVIGGYVTMLSKLAWLEYMADIVLIFMYRMDYCMG